MRARDHLTGPRIEPIRIDGQTTIPELIDGTFGAYNAGRLREGCRLFTERMLGDGVVVGVTLTGALTPAGLGVSALVPLIEHGCVDWVVATGGNLYHDAHFGLGLPLHEGSPFVPDREVREAGLVRIYDIVFEHSVLLDTDAFFRRLIRGAEFQRTMSTSEFHYLCGGYLAERERALGAPGRSLLAACYLYDVPVYTPSPGDSSIGLAIAAATLEGNRLALDPSADINEAASLLLDAKRRYGESALVVLGGGSPKNFALQLEAYLQEILGIEVDGHDYYLQITETRPDGGSLTGAEVTGVGARVKADGAAGPEEVPAAVTCYTDATIALPLLAGYALSRHGPREPKRLYQRRATLLEDLRAERDRAAGDGTRRRRVRRRAAQGTSLERDR